MISLTIFQPAQRRADARERQQRRSFEQLKEDVRLLLQQKQG